jgi:polysaccharide biosynthesis protein PslG
MTLVVAGGSRVRTAALVIATCALALAATAPTASASKHRAPREFFGVVPQTDVTPADLDQMAANRVATLRVLLYMPNIELEPGVFDWSDSDELIGDAAARGIRVIPTLYGSPGWLNYLDGNDACGGYCAPASDQTRSAWADFARAAVARYGPDGAFWTPTHNAPAPCGCLRQHPIHTWQVWNEQNSPKYFGPAPNVDQYARLLVAAGAAIHGADPEAEVITGGMWGPPGSDYVVPTIDYLRQLYAVPGIASSFDAIAVHPYSPTLDGVTTQTRAVRKEIVAAGDNARIWVTELGWASGGSVASGLITTPKGQARLLTKSIKSLLAKRRAWRIRGVLWYAWRDTPPDGAVCDWCPSSGLRNQDGTAKPAARAFRRLARRTRR